MPDRATDCPPAHANRSQNPVEIRPGRAFPLVFEDISTSCDVKNRDVVVFASFVGGCALQGSKSQSLDGCVP
jgi:hypothetical protein